ncbi:MAG: hypothetical protein H0W72_14535 [Planctomycetes bacterium]|nr:hypothetical protein [Planctomycetota bacterium]
MIAAMLAACAGADRSAPVVDATTAEASDPPPPALVGVWDGDIVVFARELILLQRPLGCYAPASRLPSDRFYVWLTESASVADRDRVCAEAALFASDLLDPRSVRTACGLLFAAWPDGGDQLRLLLRAMLADEVVLRSHRLLIDALTIHNSGDDLQGTLPLLTALRLAIVQDERWSRTAQYPTIVNPLTGPHPAPTEERERALRFLDARLHDAIARRFLSPFPFDLPEASWAGKRTTGEAKNAIVERYPTPEQMREWQERNHDALGTAWLAAYRSALRRYGSARAGKLVPCPYDERLRRLEIEAREMTPDQYLAGGQRP